MRILIPTLGRVGQQVTLRNLPMSIRERVELVVDKSEAESHGVGVRVLVLPEGVQGRIGRVRQWIIDNLPDQKIVMLDDDLRFSVRRADEPELLRLPQEGEIEQMLADVGKALDTYAMVGIASREGANRCVEPFMFNTRVMRLLAYRADVLRRENIRFDRVELMEDFDVSLQLLRAGYGNVVLNHYAHNQEGSGKSGGCATYRSLEEQGRAADRLSLLHPDHVRVVEKTTKGAWGGGTRKDVMIQWKRAYESAPQRKSP